MDAEDLHDIHWQIAEAALGARPKAVHSDPIAHHVVAGATRRIVRLHCTESSGARRDFVVKHLQHDPAQDGRWRTSDDPASPFFWRREADFYAAAQPWPDVAGLRSATPCHVSRAETRAVVVLEALPAPTAADWTLEALLALAEPLAEAQATGRAPDLPVTERPFLGAYVARRAELMDEAPALIQPTGIDAVDALADTRDDLAVLHRATGRLMAAFETVPQVFSHNDFWQPNLLGEPGGTAVLIDFAHCGLSAAGQDAANLVIDGVADGLIPPELGRPLFERFLSRYVAQFATLSGVGSADAIVETGRRAMALKYAWLIPATFKAARSDQSRARLAERHGSAERFLAKRARGLRVVAELVAETAAAYR